MKGSVFRSCAFILHPSSLILEELAVAEGFEPSHGRINSAVPYQLGYATERLFRVWSFEFRVRFAEDVTRNTKLVT